ncbi:MAG: divalent metal cation transporter [Candidatus Baltobacteraceae bacterium]
MVGATTVYGLTWLVVLLLPMLAVVQRIAASVGAASHLTLQQAIVRAYGRGAAIASLAAVVLVGLMTLGADVKAGAEALALISGLPLYAFVVPVAGIAGWLLATNSYLRIERILAAFTLIFLCYVGSAILARPDWGEVARSLIPHFEFSQPFVAGAIALLGTTMTSYTYFWESIEVAERKPAAAQLGAVKTDAVVGMLVAGSSFVFILIATAATAGKHHVVIQTAADAATALRPLAGPWDQLLFGVGLLASAAIAIPIIAATNGYAIAQTFGLQAGLGRKPSQAPLFYGVVFGSLLAGCAFAFVPVPTVSLLFWVSIAAGIATPITLALSLLVARNGDVMRGRPISARLACAGWAVTAIVVLAAAGFVFYATMLR